MTVEKVEKPLKRLQKDDLNSVNIRLWTSISMGLVFLLIGIPIWWQTTKVYRADLPFENIMKLNKDTNIKITIPINIEIKLNDFKITSLKAKLLELFNHNNGESTFVNVQYNIKINSNEINSDGVSIKFQTNPNLQKKLINIKNGVIICELRNISWHEVESMVTVIADFIKNVFVQEARLDDLVHNIYSKLDKINDTKLEIQKMRTIPPSTSYDILFSLLCPEPSKLQASWEMNKAVSCYLNPVLDKLKPVMEINIGSQILYYAGLSGSPKVNVSLDGKIVNHYLTKNQLQHIVNPIESRLGSQQSTNPTMNFIVYMTPEKYCPLYIKTSSGKISKTNTFLVPRWGAISIQNQCEKSNSGISHVQLDEKRIMEIFIPQLKLLLGIESAGFSAEGVEFISDDNPIQDYELKHLFLSRTIENIATASHTLSSLADLLGKVSNMVISDKIANDIYNSVDDILESKKQLCMGSLTDALYKSNLGFKYSEQAFYDSSLLGLLYFPEDQKFAIYIPLFLPISLPLIVSFIHALKELQKRWKKVKEQ